MEWQHPEALYVIIPLCAAWLGLALYSKRRRHVARETFAETAMWSRILPEESGLRFWLKLALREIAIVAGLVGLAGPRFGIQYEEVVPRGSDLYVVIDVSRSMLADDVPPSRLGRAKADVSSLVNRLEGERIGLIAFAGQAVVKCPLTIDYDSFRRALEELDPDSAPRGGTAIGDAIRKAIEVFHAKSDRDQAVLLITDGDDQQSYPLEAAAVASERHVTVFTVGLGDTERGARVPQKASTQTFLEYQGEQVWSKLDSHLLEQIAAKTSGVYVPAGTRSYDLGELYADHLQGRRGSDSASQQRIRRAERYQIFLGIALMSLLIDLCIAPFRRVGQCPSVEEIPPRSPASTARGSANSKTFPPVNLSTIVVTATILFGQVSQATEPNQAVREGLRFYSKEQFEEAREKFAAANEELDKQKSAAAAIASFDEACASHRKGDLEHARECYLRAGLSQDLSIATASHFNLGNLAAEQARKLCGEKPELIPPDKRQEILDQLAQAIAAYRHCLELKPDHLPSRRNLELLRQWIKYYGDRWHDQDRQKRRDESNLFQFLEFLIQSETAMWKTVTNLPDTVSADEFAEFKRVQEELTEEIPILREKIASGLRPPTDPNGPAAQANTKEIEEGITLLQGWADTAGQKMSAASRQLGVREPTKAVVEQQAAIDELDKIWEAIIPFHPLLAAELNDQTAIAKLLVPNATETEQQTDDAEKRSETLSVDDQPISKTETEGEPKKQDRPPKSAGLSLTDIDFSKLEQDQQRAVKRTRLLTPKAEAELDRLEAAPGSQPAANEEKPEEGGDQAPTQVDPEQVKAGYRKAIELVPQAVEEMEAAVQSMRQKNHQTAGQHAEEARRILDEIQQAQPKNDKKDQQKQDQKNNDDQNQKEDEKNDDDKQKDEKKDQQKDDQQSKSDQQKQDQKKQQPQLSQDRIEDALRKVREREQEKHERDKKVKGRLFGRAPVDKDW